MRERARTQSHRDLITVYGTVIIAVIVIIIAGVVAVADGSFAVFVIAVMVVVDELMYLPFLIFSLIFSLVVVVHSVFKVAWRRVDGDEFLTIGDLVWADKSVFSVTHVVQKGDVSDWNLVIQKVKATHAGLYECQITATAGYFRHIQLNVVGAYREGY